MYPNNFEANHPRDNVKRTHHFSVPEHATIPGRVTINDLPSELLLNIIKHIPDSINSGEGHVVWPIQEDFPRYNSCSLLQLALCSHSLHRLVEPVIYERFHHGYTSTKGFLLFLVRILARPDLGRYVRVFHVDSTRAPGLGTIMEDSYDDPRHEYREDHDGRYHSDFDLSYFSAEDLGAVRKKIAEASKTTQEAYEWIISVEKGDLNALIALILALTPNLQVLDIDMWIRPDSAPPILPRMLAQAGKLQRERQLGHPFALWGLKKVVVRYHHAPDLDNIVYRLISLLIIPSVEILCAIHENAGRDYYFDSPKTDVDEESLQTALQGNNLGLAPLCCYQNLKKFHYEDRLGDGADHYNELDRFKNNNLMAKASRIIPHLQDLTILNVGYIWSSVMTSSMSIFSTLTSSLAPFTNLRRLETTWLYGYGDGGPPIKSEYY
ncbi:hypothetical protein VF21_10044 [Pseudogymnoascus sp. 05NY08]|nr:hypothetical protein VF21_10044 [Pseudogymnoascus sp. 05NY08]